VQKLVNTSEDTAVVRFSRHVAERTSRRTFMRRSLTAAFAFGASAALSNAFVAPAEAAICGPSPYCASSQCSATRQDCYSSAGCRRRKYNTSSCASWTTSNCWVAVYQDTRHLCCDCCCPGGTGGLCSGCSGRKCICRFRIN
jgi:hypothetical protein